MSDSQPPPYAPRMSPFGGLKWMIPSLGVQDDQLRPDASYVDRVLVAAYNIRLCEKIFNGWATHLHKVGVKKPDERERDVRRYLGWLKESARQCSEDTDKILRCHACFAGLMVLQIDGASTSRPKGLDPSIGPSGLATVIATASRSLSQNVVKMQSDLESFVSYLKKMQVKKKSMARRILGWLKLLFDALAVIFPLGSSVAPLFHSVPPALHVISPVASAFFIAAAKLSEKAAEQLKPKDPEKLESVLRFLKNTVPKEAREAQQTLALSDAALVSMGLEEHMTTGRLLALPRLDSAAIAQEWRDVAERYLSELPETRNRSSQRDE